MSKRTHHGKRRDSDTHPDLIDLECRESRPTALPCGRRRPGTRPGPVAVRTPDQGAASGRAPGDRADLPAQRPGSRDRRPAAVVPKGLYWSVAPLGFAGLAVVLLLTFRYGVRHDCRRAITEHQIWMIRSTPSSSRGHFPPLACGLSSDRPSLRPGRYMSGASLSWRSNLLVAQWLIVRIRSRRRAYRSVPDPARDLRRPCRSRRDPVGQDYAMPTGCGRRPGLDPDLASDSADRRAAGANVRRAISHQGTRCQASAMTPCRSWPAWPAIPPSPTGTHSWRYWPGCRQAQRRAPSRRHDIAAHGAAVA